MQRTSKEKKVLPPTPQFCEYLLSWSSKRQSALSRSSAEVEYRGVANAVAETYWLHNLLREFHSPLSSATLVYCDNMLFTLFVMQSGSATTYESH
ncbi:ribonuclease H-like domain-containing protein [Tanacetum coccineum]